MKSIWICLCVCVLVVPAGCALQRAEQLGDVNVIPKPSKMEPGEGRFTLKPSTRIVVDDDSDEAQRIAKGLALRLRKATGFALPVSDRGAAQDTIRLTRADADPSLGREGYELVVQPDGVVLRAPEFAGLFYATQTLRQLFPPEIEAPQPESQSREWTIPCVRITDRPRFPWRGFMLDSARHFQEVATVERLLDVMAYYKLNRFHWHLNDDEAWRIEIAKYPKLTEIGAFPESREKTMGGFYTKDQIRHIVAYAKERYIAVIPEIEIPGHASAALYCYPEFTCKGEPFPHGSEAPWYFRAAGRQVYCASRPETFEFLKDVLTEVMEMFDTPYIHIGGDERPGGWAECPLCTQTIKEHGLKDENALQNWFMARIASFVHSKNRRTVAWAYNFKDGVPENQIVQGWHPGHSEEAAKMGFDTVNSECGFVYLDFKWHGLSLENTYSFDPVPAGLTPQQAAHVLGSEAPIWTELVADEATLFDRVFPRLLALSEVVWTPQNAREFSDFEPRTRDHKLRLARMGVTYTH